MLAGLAYSDVGKSPKYRRCQRKICYKLYILEAVKNLTHGTLYKLVWNYGELAVAF